LNILLGFATSITFDIFTQEVSGTELGGENEDQRRKSCLY